MATGVPLQLHFHPRSTLSFSSTTPHDSLLRCSVKCHVNHDQVHYQNVQASVSEKGKYSRRDMLGSCATAGVDQVHYQNVQASVSEKGKYSRRDMLGSCATAGVAVIWSLSPALEIANAADLIQRQQRSEFLRVIKDLLTDTIKAHPELIPSIMRLALNDAITYDKASKTGGANGSIRFISEINRPENKGLLPAMNLLEGVKEEIDASSKGGLLSYADLIQFAGQAATKSTFLSSAIRKCGGDVEKGQTVYTAFGSNGQWGLFDRQFGRTDVEAADPEGRVPSWEESSVAEMKRRFSEVGFGPRQLAVMSAFLASDQAAMEAKLASDPEVAPWVEKYRRSRETISETDYDVDLITTFTKIGSFGQNINYEAYTYPRPKVDFSKLKL